ncbi:MAG: GDP-mannose 4,6-dehydratase [Candidatus Azambacteria bacterium]|nr:GDP-mannose 4,6-dehydratase [Candidatus Azambacteria bacterium]
MAEKIAIIGSNSFSGSHLVDFFLKNTDWEIIGISRSPEYPSLFLPYLYKKKRSPRFRFFRLNINTQLPDIIQLLDKEKPEIIVNFAAQGNVQYSWSHPMHWLMTNVIGISNFAFNLKDKDYLEKYIQISTPEIYGLCRSYQEDSNCYNPSTPYAVSKVASDLFLMAMFKKFGFPASFIRSVNVYGIHQQLYRIIPRTIIFLKKGLSVPLHGGGKAQRSFIHISDVCRGIHRVILSGRAGEAYHFSGGNPMAIRDLVKLICQKMNREFEMSTEITEDRADQDPMIDLDCSKAKEELLWQSQIELYNGIDEVIQWIGESWNEILKYPLDYVHQE